MEQDHIGQAIEAWIATKFRISQSQETKKCYMKIVMGFRSWLQRTGIDLDPDVWAEGEGERAKKRALARIAMEAQKFANHSSKGKTTISNATYAQRISILCSFYAFAIKRDFFDCPNPISKIERPRLQHYGKVQPLNTQHVVSAMQAIDRADKKGARDYTLIAVLLQTGRRLSEVASLRWKHVKLAQGKLEDLESIADIRLELTFERCKGGDTARHELSQLLSIELLKSLALTYEINPLYLDGARALWPGFRGRSVGQPLGKSGISRVVGQRLGTTAVHRLRHTNALALRTAGLSIEEIQMLLGHKHLSTTAIYLPAISVHRNTKVTEVDSLLLGAEK